MRRVGALGALLLVVLSLLSARLFVWPAVDAPQPADAVVMFAGGRGERLAVAEHRPRPDPDTTRGEARLIASLAEEKG